MSLMHNRSWWLFPIKKNKTYRRNSGIGETIPIDWLETVKSCGT